MLARWSSGCKCAPRSSVFRFITPDPNYGRIPWDSDPDPEVPLRRLLGGCALLYSRGCAVCTCIARGCALVYSRGVGVQGGGLARRGQTCLLVARWLLSAADAPLLRAHPPLLVTSQPLPLLYIFSSAFLRSSVYLCLPWTPCVIAVYGGQPLWRKSVL